MDELVKYRLDNAKEKLKSAKLLLDAEEQYAIANEYCITIEDYLNHFQ